MDVKFIGGVGTVTGSKTLVTEGKTRILVDCGMFQGLKALRLQNRRAWPFDPAELDAVVLTHAHTDHSGLLPRLLKDGFRGPVHCTVPTLELCEILLPDSGRIQEEDARYLNQRGLTKHKPATPLFTEAEARQVLPRLTTHSFADPWKIGSVHVHFNQAGHILGAASIVLKTEGTSLCFSGDLGRPETPLVVPPEPFEGSDWLVLESTYGNRLHPALDPVDELEAIVRRAVERKAVLIIPTFAVDRAQTLLYCLHQVFDRDGSLRVPVYLDSPMATDVTQVYCRHPDFHRLSGEEATRVCRLAVYVNSVAESKELNDEKGPLIILAASGMIEGGRVLHHLKAHAGDPANLICLTGYQAAGTRGADIAAGAASIKIHGRYVPIRAEVVKMATLSAHADQQDLVNWAGSGPQKPREIFLMHGEPVAADALRRKLVEELDVPVHVPEPRDVFTLEGSGAVARG